ncbi:DNA polymerase III subunit delta' [Brevibacillus laterosporus]|uniref:DNA polymerase III subunit delta' n=1 Tax=Brevibacillus laterosporus TaxID=1465 RepID=A0AAP3G835_BRELA|nr:DNA polymerase III subunit delta' [Brevibacillus laterosporus]ATO49457.1 DNA polymerase III subunit delta' [Brevibacillus laterosporus DSM 25]AYB40445.1 DNA polymerase III subunit delta' [Brevibacillus laterosporus]MBG9772307.1 DNA polymerase III subunit delta' [Brevibacillus laterosporus]MBG9802098.1 DNA polymerase III subunit delta' [Brevibacillus laterosporus]MBM7109372.1 DNA polymerase III subunit tau [Brevibacillus laterosporus]
MSWSNVAKKQERVSEILANSMKHDRLAHAYLFTGPKGVGKMEVAEHLTKSIFCLDQPGDACGTCLNCQRIQSGNHPDVYRISPDGASVKIEQIRALQKEMKMRAVESKNKVYILEHVDKMTTQAANSLLKFLEEPPVGVLALLLSENSHAILPTILSRCQTVVFNPLPVEMIVQSLVNEGITKGLAQVASQITTNLDDARLLSQSEWFAQLKAMVIQLGRDLKQRDSQALFTIQDQFQRNDRLKEELPLFLDLLILWLRDILYIQVGRRANIINIDQQDALEEQALQWAQTEILRGIDVAMETRNRIERNANPQLALERLVLHIQEG